MNYLRKLAPPAAPPEVGPDHVHDMTSQAGPSTSGEPSFDQLVHECRQTISRYPVVPDKRPVGRPKKTDEEKAKAKAERKQAGKAAKRPSVNDIDEGIQLYPSPKRRRGRPRKSETVTIAPLLNEEDEPGGLSLATGNASDGMGDLLQTFAGQPVDRGPRVLRLKRSQLKNPATSTSALSNEAQNEGANLADELVDEDDWGPYQLRDRSAKKKKKNKDGTVEGKGRKPLSPPKYDAETGALYNFIGQSFKGKRGKKVMVGDSASYCWLNFWTEQEKNGLISTVVKYGIDAPAEKLRKFVPLGASPRPLRDVEVFVQLLRSKSKKLVYGAKNFDLDCALNSQHVMAAKLPFARNPVGYMHANTPELPTLLKQAFLQAVDTPEKSEEAIEENNLDFDRVYRVLGKCFDPKSTAESLAKLVSPVDIRMLRHLLSRIETTAATLTEQNGPLVQTIVSRMKAVDLPASAQKESLDSFPFGPHNTDTPQGDFGQIAQQLACIPDVNNLRLRPSDLIFNLDDSVPFPKVS